MLMPIKHMFNCYEGVEREDEAVRGGAETLCLPPEVMEYTTTVLDQGGWVKDRGKG